MRLSEAIRIQRPELPYVAAAVEECFHGDIELSAFGRPEMERIKRFCIEKYSANSAKNYLANIRAVLGIYRDEGELKCNDFGLLSVKGEATINIFVDTDELRKVEKYMRTARPLEKYYALYFLCSAYTGCRASDVRCLSKGDIRKGMLSYVSDKTGIKAEVPAKKGLGTWLELIEQLELQKFDFSLPMYNRMIKIICKEAGVNAESSIYKAGKKQTGPKWQFVSSHTARRSFATNLYLAGCDLYAISRMMGHSSVDMTERYICCGLRELDSRVMKYFE